MPDLSLLSQIKIASYPYCHSSKLASFILNVTDQNCQLFNVEVKMSDLSVLWRIKRNASLIFIFVDQSCQFYLHCLRWKLASFNIKCHRSKLPAFHCWSWKMPVLSVLLRLKRNASLIFIVADQSCQFYLHCHR